VGDVIKARIKFSGHPKRAPRLTQSRDFASSVTVFSTAYRPVTNSPPAAALTPRRRRLLAFFVRRFCVPSARVDGQSAHRRLTPAVAGPTARAVLKIKGRSVYGEVLEISGGQVRFRPLCPAAGWHRASAREIVGHWRETGRRGGQADVDTDAAPRPPRARLALPELHP